MVLVGKVALITGAAQGLGKAFSEALLKRGARVAMLDMKRDEGQKTGQEMADKFGPEKSTFIQCDVTAKEQLDGAFDAASSQFGGLDLVVNNAGILNEVQWERCLAVNLEAVTRGTYNGLSHMSTQNGGRGGHIINVASIAGLLSSIPAAPMYAASKHGVVALSRCLGHAMHYKRHGVRVNALCPSFTDTDIINVTEDSMGKDYWMVPKTFEKLGGLLPVSTVVEGFLQLVEDDTQNGAVMRVTLAKGIDYKQYREDL
ncbi:15-hydroxyprostaglandin dehydrogenase [NAD(+)]-like [Branchiostoma lanceolatum]|uniref:15-hydroxyprostaglandin dehydrogenase [NAD(+)] n=2 Tax=Branchiostoma lanceolatum TaxID=7740 RepID=A0A8K0EZZ2_BRALA|nr:HPGD [Branchiostoma lanceolatum]